jgi:Mn2+/Fe2+ NRAMP family transporter
VVPHIELNGAFIGALVAILGTTISPYLFFWQASSEVDEMKAAGQTLESQRRGIVKGELQAARIDILVGMGFSQIVMFSIILTGAAVLNAHGTTTVQTAQDAASALTPFAGRFAFVIFSVGLIGTGLLAIPVLSGSAAYALKEFFGFGGGLAVKPRYRPTFYLVIGLATLVGLGMDFVGLDPIRALFITAVINGIVAPPMLILITILGSDRSVMGEHVSRGVSRALTWVAAGVMSVAALALVVTLIPH